MILSELESLFVQCSSSFTADISMLLPALIISEAKTETRLLPFISLFFITVDSQKVFDVVSRMIKVDKLNGTRIHP